MQGEWLAFTSRAEEGGFWDVGASVASGINGSTIEFRLLVNATNCSSPETDGFNGLGDGIDLLGGPVMHGDTGSWEAFEMATREEVWVPKGDHRVLFCSDSDFFNLNYLRIWTPAPTPAPTQVPTPAPTPAPQVPGDDGDDTKWIYISVSAGSTSRSIREIRSIGGILTVCPTGGRLSHSSSMHDMPNNRLTRPVVCGVQT